MIKQHTYYRTDDMQQGKNVHVRPNPPRVWFTSNILYIYTIGILIIRALLFIAHPVSVLQWTVLILSSLLMRKRFPASNYSCTPSGPSPMVLVLIIIVNHTFMWYSLKTQGEVVGRRKRSNLAQGRLETKAEAVSPKNRDGEQGQGTDS